MRVRNDLIRSAVIRFAEIVDQVGKRVHIGVIMAAGRDWVEISVPELLNLDAAREIRFLPTLLSHAVTIDWRTLDRVGLAYVNGGPQDDRFAGLPGFNDSRSAEEMQAYTPAWRIHARDSKPDDAADTLLLEEMAKLPRKRRGD